MLLIADDVITGFGRTGRWFGLEHYGVEPDIMQFAKGITSGYVPLGGIGVSDKRPRGDERRAGRQALDARLHLFGPSDVLRGGAGQPRHLRERRPGGAGGSAAASGCCRGCATLESLDGVGHVRGLGLMAAVEVVADKATKQLHAPELGVTQKLTDAMLERGLYTRVAMDCICIAPPLVTADADLDLLVDTVRESIAAVLQRSARRPPPRAERSRSSESLSADRDAQVGASGPQRAPAPARSAGSSASDAIASTGASRGARLAS